MEDIIVESLIAQGQIVKLADLTDQANDFVIVGVYQNNLNKRKGAGTSYKNYVISIAELTAGGGGGGGDKNFVYTQVAPSTTWVVNHNLAKRVAVNVVDAAGIAIIGEVRWNSDNQVTVLFNQPVTGAVYCN